MSKTTGIVMLNMGGPKFSHESGSYLMNLFNDKELIDLPLRSVLAPLISRLRGKKLEKKYDLIGGGSPIHKWTHIQGAKMCGFLDKISPETSPHKYYVGFRYVSPFTNQAIDSALKDGVSRLIFFSQYPQFSCTTSGSSFNEVAAYFRKNPSNIPRISMIDRWYDHPSYIKAFSKNIKKGLEQIDVSVRDSVPIVFSAHSIPLSVAKRGDCYPHEVSSTVHEIVKESGIRNPYYLAWQSKVGYAQWMEPDTDVVVDTLIEKGMGVNGILLAPVSFTSDHIETSFDIDINMKTRINRKYRFRKLYRIPSFNDQDHFAQALADIAADHINGVLLSAERYTRRCHECTNPRCSDARKLFIS